MHPALKFSPHPIKGGQNENAPPGGLGRLLTNGKTRAVERGVLAKPEQPVKQMISQDTTMFLSLTNGC